ncbi:MAG: hypothetical protein HFJ12_07525 [Bacilli bacterium]|nr:hypothetical protein [Bacilli bacterium]
MKQDKIKLVISVILMIVVILSFFTVKKDRVSSDEKKFKEEYEELNGVENPSSGKKYFDLKVELHNGVEYLDAEEAIDFLEKKTGILYFGFPQCPWCRNIVEVLLEAKKELKVGTIYYCNALEIRDEKILQDGKVVTTKKGSKEYDKILELLGDKADSYDGLHDESIKRLYFPTVVFVKNGEVIDTHMSTVDSQKDPYKRLNKEQQKELKNIYIKNIQKINGVVCSSDTAC